MKKYIALLPILPIFLIGCGKDETAKDYTENPDDVPNLIDDSYEFPQNEYRSDYSDNGVVYDENDYKSSFYVDGIYKAEAKEYDGLYKHYVELTIKDGSIYKVLFDGKDKTGNLKSNDNDLIKTYKDEYNASPKDMIDMYVDKLLDSQAVDMVKSMVGGEDLHEVFQKLINSALINASKGDSEVTAIVDTNL